MRALNDLRKEVGLAIADRVTVTVAADGPVADAVDPSPRLRGRRGAGRRAVGRAAGGDAEGAHALTIDGHPVHVSIARA